MSLKSAYESFHNWSICVSFPKSLSCWHTGSPFVPLAINNSRRPTIGGCYGNARDTVKISVCLGSPYPFVYSLMWKLNWRRFFARLCANFGNMQKSTFPSVLLFCFQVFFLRLRERLKEAMESTSNLLWTILFAATNPCVIELHHLHLIIEIPNTHKCWCCKI